MASVHGGVVSLNVHSMVCVYFVCTLMYTCNKHAYVQYLCMYTIYISCSVCMHMCTCVSVHTRVVLMLTCVCV